MRILFIGGKRRGTLCLKSLIENKITVVGLIALKEDKHEHIYYDKIEDVAVNYGIPYCIPNNINSPECIEFIHNLTPDIFLIMGWRQIIRPEVIKLGFKGAFLVHDTLLPYYRGSAPTNWPILMGETVTGLTLISLDTGVDTGDIVGQIHVPIYPSDDAGTVIDRKDEACVQLILDFLSKIDKGNISPQPQEQSAASYMAPRIPDDGLIDWTMSIEEIDRLVRAITYPWPGAFTFWDDRKLIIWSTEIYDNRSPRYHGVYGQVVARIKGKGVLVMGGDNVILVKDVQLEGQKRKPAFNVLKPSGIRLGISLLEMFRELKHLKEEICALRNMIKTSG